MIKHYVERIRYKTWYLLNKNKYKYLGVNSIVISPLKVYYPENITISENVRIGYKSWIAADARKENDVCELIFGEGCLIGSFNHIYATEKIEFGKNVLTADRVYISDNLHRYDDVTIPIMKQGIKQLKNVCIGDGAWIGENACIIGASIGKNCVIGANSVVTKDIPDFSVAVGAPARVIKKYCLETSSWINV